MATITQTEVKVYLKTKSDNTLVGTITLNGEQANVFAGLSTLGSNLNPGSKYYAEARCTNDNNYASEWSNLFPFTTLINGIINSLTVESDIISVDDFELEYDSDDITPTSIYLMYSEYATGRDAIELNYRDETAINGAKIQVGQNKTYYFNWKVVDSEERTSQGAWDNAYQIFVPYLKPTITVEEVTSKLNSVSTTYRLTSADVLSVKEVGLRLAGSQTMLYVFDMENLADGSLQSVTFSTGQPDREGNAVTIAPNTTYEFVYEATNSAGTTIVTRSVTTPAQSGVVITSVSDMTTNSAVVNLEYSGIE